MSSVSADGVQPCLDLARTEEIEDVSSVRMGPVDFKEDHLHPRGRNDPADQVRVSPSYGVDRGGRPSGDDPVTVPFDDSIRSSGLGKQEQHDLTGVDAG